MTLAAAEASQKQNYGTVIGIDLGTTYSCVGVFKNDDERLIGEAAKNQAALNTDHTIFDVKRLIGRKFDDPEVQQEIKRLPCKIVNKNGKPYIEVEMKNGEIKNFSPEEISAMTLQKMKQTAESYLGKEINHAVITVPDQQTTVSIKVYEGERSLTKGCHELGRFDLSGIPPAPRGVPQIEVTFEVDRNGILQVTAMDKAAKNSESITITNEKGRLSEEEIQNLVKEAEEYAEEDKKN
ncbi:hypothetical protein M9H77_00972 [Catharanthus roseus]|uniref:Uncharacterized protein n=1 Tax=Catharanthus roseus TaxID=4058 RepID=A0ACC0C479_CATRO|nr:hypothetical protein M9H77_00972 [Catharanthus roseus]